MRLYRRGFLASGLSLFPLAAALPWWLGHRPDDRKPVGHTAASQAAIDKGLRWLQRTESKPGGHGPDINTPPNIGCTAMTGLALLSNGSTPAHGPQKEHLRRIVKFLVDKTDEMEGGNIAGKSNNSQLQSDLGYYAHTFFALLFLSQVAGEVRTPGEVRDAVEKLTEAVVKAQTPNGDWGQEAWAPILGTVMAWTSLRSAHFAGVSVGGSPDKTAEHLIGEMEKQAHQGNWMHRFYKNATGLRVLYAMDLEEEEVAQRAFKEIISLAENNNTAFNQAGGEEYLAFHLITETMLQKQDGDWDIWFPMVRDKIVAVQNKDGSWTGHHCITSRTFCTAAACTVLSAPNRFLPISQG